MKKLFSVIVVIVSLSVIPQKAIGSEITVRTAVEPVLDYDSAYFSTAKEGLIRVFKNDKCGFIDRSGNVIIPLIYDWADDFSEGLVSAGVNGKFGAIDRTGNIIVPFIYDYVYGFSEGVAAVYNNGKFGYVDKTGKEIVAAEYDYAGKFNEGLALIQKEDKAGFIDTKGNVVIPPVYDWAWDFSEGLASVGKNGKCGILEKVITANPTTSKIFVNGTETSFDSYEINGNNYFKLRDIAFVINGSQKQFEVSWAGDKNAINLISNNPYTTVGSEMITSGKSLKYASLNYSKIYKDNLEINPVAYTINDNNYFKLRDIAEEFNFGVFWDSSSNNIMIDTNSVYTRQ